jgi:hypothetical protein
MNSPFPGVDPYLEAQGFWPEFHSKFVNAWQEALLAALPPSYDARLDERVYLVPQEYEARESYIQIVKRPERTLIAVLELLSPTNKGTERPMYLKKLDEVLSTAVHLVELDLLLCGHRLPVREQLPPAHYYAFLSRSERRPKIEVVSWTVRVPLPKIAIPLAGDAEQVTIDLQSVFSTAYERGGYPRAVVYAADVQLPVAQLDREWILKQARHATPSAKTK